MVAEGLGAAHHDGECWHEAELHRLKGDLLIRRHASRASRLQPGSGQMIDTQVERCFHQALAIARRQHAKSLELRAAMSLARLWQRQGKRADAHDLLAPIYRWFTEGFDTADIRDAKMLLGELR
jgi:predicted ATPase